MSKIKILVACEYSGRVRDAFIPPKPFASWNLNEDSCLWEAPVAYPSDGKLYRWDEDTTNWIEIVQE